MQFLILPDDVHICVLTTLDFWSLVSCEQTCHPLRRLLHDNAYLRYIKASLASGKCPVPNTVASAKALHEAFLVHEKAWKNPTFFAYRRVTLKYRFPDEHRPNPAQYHITDQALYAIFDREHLVITRLDLDSGALQDPFIVEEGIHLDENRVSIAVDEGQDLLVLTHQTGWRCLTVKCYSTGDGKAHPKATEIIKYPIEGVHLYPSIYGSYLCIPNEENIRQGAVILNWKKSRDSEIFFSDGVVAAFLSPEMILVQKNACIECVSVPSDPGDNPNPLFSLEFPPLEPRSSYSHKRMMVPKGRPFNTPESKDPRSVDSSFIVVMLRITWLTNTNQSWCLLIHRESLINNPQLLALSASQPNPLHWQQWSALVPTTILGPITTSLHADSVVPMGNRLLVSAFIPHVGYMLDVYEFLPPRGVIDVNSANTTPFCHPPSFDLRYVKRTHQLPVGNGSYLCGPRHIVNCSRPTPHY